MASIERITWAKLVRDEDDRVVAALPLLDHLLDIAACGEALLRAGAWRRALETTAGRPLTELDWLRIVVLIALHDIGKANRGFQARWDRRAERIGHEGQVFALLSDKRLAATEAGQALRGIVAGWGANQHLAALMAHHGRPREQFHKGPFPNASWESDIRLWQPDGAYDPVREAAGLIAQVRTRWPGAWEDGPKLPAEPRFVALFAGLVTLADWLGSDAKRFPVEGPHGADRDALRRAMASQAVTAEGLVPLATPPADFAAAFGFGPRGVQGDAAAGDLGQVALIEAETGSGKTEAALWRWLALRREGLVDGLYFALPTRSAAVQLHRRVDDMLVRIWGENGPRAFLAVPGYRRVGDAEGEPLPGWAVSWDDGRDDGRWAAERANRFLAARVAVGTIDQALLAALQVRHAHVRGTALARNLLVVDEVHASDAYQGALLERLIANHVGAGGHALLLSATLGAEARARLLGGPCPPLAEAEALPYPALAGTAAPLRAAPADGVAPKPVTVEVAGLIDDPDAIARTAVGAARQGASVLVVRNSVAGAVAVARAVEELAPDLAFRVNDVATLHHGRFAPGDRQLLDAEVETAFGKGRSAKGRVLVGTQTLEQSLDIDADLLLTDLAPMDVLLQRIGRLHRHRTRSDRGAFAEARAVILRPAERDLTRLLGRVRDRHGLGPMKDGRGVYPDLLQLEATLRLLEANPKISIPADNRRLVEGALHPDTRAALTAALGTAWRNHDADLTGIAHAERQEAVAQSLDHQTEFRKLLYPDAPVGTRLGTRDLLVDFAQPLAGPFGEPVSRLTIPHWMAGGIAADATPVPGTVDADGQRFTLGGRSYLYGRFGLSPDPAGG